MPLPLCSTFWRVKKPLICPIKVISYSSEEYFSLLFLSLMQFSVSSDPTDILCVALYLFLQQCFTVPMRKSMYQIFSYRGIGARFSQPTSELLQEPKKWLKADPDPLDGTVDGYTSPYELGQSLAEPGSFNLGCVALISSTSPSAWNPTRQFCPFSNFSVPSITPNLGSFK